MSILDRFKTKTPLIFLAFSMDSEDIEVVCENNEVISGIHDNEKNISIELNTLKRLIPDKYRDEIIQVFVYLDGDIVSTKLKYTFKLNGCLKNSGNLICDRLNKIFGEILKKIIFKAEDNG